MKTMIGAALAAGSFFVATSAAADDLQVAYTVAVAAVPTLTEWAMILMGVVLAAAAVMALRQRRIGGGIAMGVVALISAGALGMAGKTEAASLSLSLDGNSPNVVNLPPASGHTITVTNNAGVQVILDSITIINGSNFLPTGGDCSTDMTLAAGASCTIVVTNFSS
jgi:hypothetical protein